MFVWWVFCCTFVSMKKLLACILLFATFALASCSESKNYEATMLDGVVFNTTHHENNKGGDTNYIIIGDAHSNTYKVDVADATQFKLGQEVQYILVIEEAKAPITKVLGK